MKKIMFDNHFGLEDAVLNGTKTMTRRILKPVAPAVNEIRIENGIVAHRYSAGWFTAPFKHQPKYRIGEVVAIAQSYHTLNKSGYVAPEWLEHTCESSAGYKNKMFVRADLMPHQIQITDVRVERLQDISDEDCLREGIVYENPFPGFNGPNVFSFPVHGKKHSSTWRSPTPRIAFENLIRHMMGKKVWDDNPYVFVYSFKLIK